MKRSWCSLGEIFAKTSCWCYRRGGVIRDNRNVHVFHIGDQVWIELNMVSPYVCFASDQALALAKALRLAADRASGVLN